MKFFKIICCIVAMLFSQGALALDQASNDSSITQSIQSQIASDPALSGLNIQISTKDGEVILIGKTHTDTEASKIIEIAQSTAGVKDVNTQELTAKDSKQPFADMVITAKVKGTYIREKLFGDQDVSVMSVKVETNNGTVYLTGTVATKEEAMNAVKLAKEVKGVRNVESKIEIKSVG